jgi:hypothetical protein
MASPICVLARTGLTLLCALLLIQPSLSMASRSTTLINGTSSYTSGGRRLLESDSISMRVDLVHRDSIKDDLTVTERIRLAVDRSNSRARSLARFLNPAGASFETKDFQSPVAIGNGEYVMSLDLGTPSKTYSVIVDTGSDLTWIQCQPCTTCFQQPSPMFDPTSSSCHNGHHLRWDSASGECGVRVWTR